MEGQKEAGSQDNNPTIQQSVREGYQLIERGYQIPDQKGYQPLNNPQTSTPPQGGDASIPVTSTPSQSSNTSSPTRPTPPQGGDASIPVKSPANNP